MLMIDANNCDDGNGGGKGVAVEDGDDNIDNGIDYDWLTMVLMTMVDNG